MSKPLTERNQTEQAGLLEISLVCSVLALGLGTLLLKTLHKLQLC